MPNLIALKGDFIRKEGEASSAITPGDLVEFGGINDLQTHGSAGGPARKAFAIENDLIGDAIGDDYAAGDTVQYGVFVPGAEVNALLNYPENVSKGDPLVSGGDGGLVAFIESTHEAGAIVGFANAALDTTSLGAQARIVIEVA